MNIIAIGDVVGTLGCEHLRKKLPELKRLKGVDLVIANGENSADGNGITPTSAEFLFDSGVDIITTGNHTFRRQEFHSYIDEHENIIRPANFPENTPGKGYAIFDMGRVRVAVINLMGVSFMEPLADPFDALEKILEEDLPKIKLVDFHAEATGEKRALGFFADGRVSALFGTHTHVPTADECILPQGTGYISDLGMTGVINSALGVKPELVIKKLRSKLPVRFENAEGDCKMDCVLFDIDEQTGRCVDIERMSIL